MSKKIVKLCFTTNGEYFEAEPNKFLFNNKVERIKRIEGTNIKEHFEVFFENDLGSVWIYNPSLVFWATLKENIDSVQNQPNQ